MIVSFMSLRWRDSGCLGHLRCICITNGNTCFTPPRLSAHILTLLATRYKFTHTSTRNIQTEVGSTKLLINVDFNCVAKKIF